MQGISICDFCLEETTNRTVLVHDTKCQDMSGFRKLERLIRQVERLIRKLNGLIRKLHLGSETRTADSGTRSADSETGLKNTALGNEDYGTVATSIAA